MDSIKQKIQKLGKAMGRQHVPNKYTDYQTLRTEYQTLATRDVNQLQKEVFGPCVPVIRFKGTEINDVIEQINSTGFG